jgi:hypothetical protein
MLALVLRAAALIATLWRHHHRSVLWGQQIRIGSIVGHAKEVDFLPAWLLWTTHRNIPSRLAVSVRLHHRPLI